MSTSVASRAQLLTAAFVALASLTTWSITTAVHPDVQLTVKSSEQSSPAASSGQERAAISAGRWHG